MKNTLARIFNGFLSPLFGLPLLLALFCGATAIQAQPADYSPYVKVVTNTPNLLGYWRFDTNFLTNSYVNGYTGALQGDAAIGGPGSGSPLAGDALNQGLLLPDGAGYLTTDLVGGITNEFTLMAWINIGAYPGGNYDSYYEILDQQESGDDCDLIVFPSGQVYFYTDAGGSDEVNTPNPIPLNQWHFIAGTMTNGGARCIYLDGTLASVNTAGTHHLSTGAVYIGYGPVFTPRHFVGSIDEAAVFNRALSASEILAIYLSALGDPQSLSLNLPAEISEGSLQASLSGTFSTATNVDLTSVATFAASPTNVLSVNSNGLVTALTTGSATLTASYGGLSVTNSVTVGGLPLHRYSFTVDASDSIGGANGALQGNATISGGQVMLDGLNSWVLLPSGLLNGYSAATIETWLTWQGPGPGPSSQGGAYQRVFDIGNNDQPPGTPSPTGAQYGSITLVTDDDADDLSFWDVDTTTYGGVEEQVVEVLSTNVQHDVVWSYDGDTSIVYVDGVALNLKNPLTVPYHFLDGTNIWFGQSLSASDGHFWGSMSEIRISDVALTPQQIALDAASGPDTLASPGVFQSLTLSVAASMSAGQGQNATVTGNWGNVSNVNLTLFSSYSSSATNVLTVNSQGAITALSPGRATVTATYNGVDASQSINVAPGAALLAHRYSFFNGTANDSVGTANGTLQGNATLTGGALNLDGSAGAYVTLPAGTIDSTFAAMTIEMWANIQRTPNGNTNFISAFGNPAGSFIRLGTHNSSGSGNAFIDSYSGGLDTIGWKPGPVVGNVHLVAEWNPLAGTMEFYENGHPVNGNNITTLLSAMNSAQDVANVIGANIDGTDGMVATIQEYRIYNGALTLPQIRTSLAAGPTNAPIITNQISAGTITNVTVTTHPNFIVGTIQDPVVLASSATVQNINLTAVSNVTFTSGNTNVLVVLANNQVQAVGVGTATLTASYLGVSGQASVTTKAAPPLLLTHRYSFVSDASDSVAGENGALMGDATASGGLNLNSEGDGQGYGDYLALPRDVVGGYPALTVETWMNLGTQVGGFCRIFSFSTWTYGGGGDLAGILLSPEYPGPTLTLIVNPQVGVVPNDEMDLPSDSPSANIFLQNAGLVQVVAVLDPVNQQIGALYYNGQLAGSRQFAHPLTQVEVEHSLFGKSAHVNDPFLVGTINELRVYYGAMTAGQVASNYAAGITNVGVNVGAAQISDPPLAQTVLAGEPVTFSVGAVGAPPLSYQWYLGANAIAGATDATFTIPSTSTGNAGLYSVQVSNSLSLGSPAVSLGVDLTVDSAVSLTNGVETHLTFDGNYNDVSGNGNDGQAGGSPVFITGKIGSGAIHVNTIAGNVFNYVSVPTSTTFSYAGDFSVAFWQKHTGLPNDLPMVGNAINSTYQLGWVLTEDLGRQEASLDGGGFIIFDPATGSPIINDGEWHHAALVINRELEYAAVYVDGRQAGFQSLDSLGDVLLGNLSTGNAIFIGQDPTGTYGVSGEYDIDDLILWGRALAAGEVQAVYTLGQAGQSISNGFVPETLTLLQTPNGCQLNWTSGVLQSAPTLLGPWAAVPGATAPSFQFTPSSPTNQFFRVQLNGGTLP